MVVDNFLGQRNRFHQFHFIEFNFVQENSSKLTKSNQFEKQIAEKPAKTKMAKKTKKISLFANGKQNGDTSLNSISNMLLFCCSSISNMTFSTLVPLSEQTIQKIFGQMYTTTTSMNKNKTN